MQEEDRNVSTFWQFFIVVDVNQKVVFNVTSQQLRMLAEIFIEYIPENEVHYKENLWINNPFLEYLLFVIRIN